MVRGLLRLGPAVLAASLFSQASAKHEWVSGDANQVSSVDWQAILNNPDARGSVIISNPDMTHAPVANSTFNSTALVPGWELSVAVKGDVPMSGGGKTTGTSISLKAPPQVPRSEHSIVQGDPSWHGCFAFLKLVVSDKKWTWKNASFDETCGGMFDRDCLDEMRDITAEYNNFTGATPQCSASSVLVNHRCMGSGFSPKVVWPGRYQPSETSGIQSLLDYANNDGGLDGEMKAVWLVASLWGSNSTTGTNVTNGTVRGWSSNVHINCLQADTVKAGGHVPSAATAVLERGPCWAMLAMALAVVYSLY